MAVPGKVTGLSATAHTTTSVRLQWDATATADTYNVYYKIPSVGTYTQITGVGTITYDVTSLLSCNLYDFKVAAVNVDGEGEHSDVIQGRPGCEWALEFLDVIEVDGSDLVTGATYEEVFADTIVPTDSVTLTPVEEFVDSVAITEHLEVRTQQETAKDWVDVISLTEAFSTTAYTLAYTEGSILLVGR